MTDETPAVPAKPKRRGRGPQVRATEQGQIIGQLMIGYSVEAIAKQIGRAPSAIFNIA